MQWVWDDKCQELSDNLGTFDNIVKSDIYHDSFQEKYDFNYYEGIKSSKNLKFKKIPLTDNTTKKEKLKKKLLETELKRYKKEIKKNRKLKNKAKTKKYLKQKHIDFIKKIDLRVNQLDLLIKTRIVKLNPTSVQIKIFKYWMNSCDAVFNHLLSQFNKSFDKFKENNPDLDFYNTAKEFKKKRKYYFNFIGLRNKFIDFYTKKYKKVPYCVLANAVREFVTTLKSIFTKILKGQIDNFELKSRCIFRYKRSITIDKKYLKSTGPYPTILNVLKINNTRENNKFRWLDVKKDFKIVHLKYEGNFYLHAPVLVPRKPPVENRSKVVSIDPGENKFVVGYSLDHYFYIGKKIRDRIRKRLKKIDKLKSKMDFNGRRKWKYKKAIKRHEKKILNDRDELHHKLNLFLVRNYERIVIPDFSSKNVSSKKKNLEPLTKRVLGKLSHSIMRERLKSKCKEYSCHYIEGNESYTSQMCGLCGTLNPEVKANKERIYRCKKCGFETDRDSNGSRNILIKNHEKVFK